MASNNVKITRATREEILTHVLAGREGTARWLAVQYGLAANYPEKLARARGLVPRTAKRWGKLQEAA